MWFKRSKPCEPRPAPTEVSVHLIEETIKSFVAKKSKLVKTENIQSNTPLFSSGILDSLAFVQLVVLLESDFRVRLSRTGPVTMDELDSIGQIAEKILRMGNANVQ